MKIRTATQDLYSRCAREVSRVSHNFGMGFRGGQIDYRNAVSQMQERWGFGSAPPAGDAAALFYEEAVAARPPFFERAVLRIGYEAGRYFPFVGFKTPLA